MENNKIIIILLVIIVILVAAIGFVLLNPTTSKEPTKLKLTSNDTLYEGKDLTLKLTDFNKTPLSNQNVDITIKNSKGKVIANKTVKTNDKGNAKMDLKLNKGKYDVVVSYAGNENYTGNNTTQELTIKEKVVEAQQSASSSSSSETPRYTTDEHGTYDEVNERYIDGQNKGLSRAETEAFWDKVKRDGGMI